MNKKEAYRRGIARAEEAYKHGDFTPEERTNEDKFYEAIGEILDNARQYAGHPTEGFSKERNGDELHDSYDAGEAKGSERAWKEQEKKNRQQEKEDREAREASDRFVYNELGAVTAEDEGEYGYTVVVTNGKNGNKTKHMRFTIEELRRMFAPIVRRHKEAERRKFNQRQREASEREANQAQETGKEGTT